jgi:hypothetical protein
MLRRLVLLVSLLCGMPGQGWAQNALLRDYSCADAGANDTYACSLSVSPGSYVSGQRYLFSANTANTGAATVNFNTLGAKTIKKAAGGITTDLADNDIRAGQWVHLLYDGTNMQMLSTLGNAPVGSGTVTSVAQTFTGGLVSVGGSPVTASGTLALTVAGTSGGIPYFDSASTWLSSAALTSNSLVLGGGAGAAPKVAAGLITDGTSKLTLGVAGTSVGSVDFKNATSGTITLAPVTGALGTVTVSIPAATDTLVNLTSAQTLTTKTLTLPIISSISNSGTVTIPTGTDTLVNLAGTQTLTGKTLTTPTITSLANTLTKSIWFDAGALQVDGTQCAAPAQITLNSGPILYTIICTDNDAATIYGSVKMPDSWNGGTVTFTQVYVQTAANTGVLNGDIACQARSNGEVPSSTWGTEVAIDDAAVVGSNSNDMTTSGAATCAGTGVAGGDMLYFRYQVDATGTTTTAASLHTLGFMLEYGVVNLSD